MELKDIVGVGEKRILELQKLGIYNIEDLITYYPKRYFILRRSNLSKCLNGDKVVVDGKVVSFPIISGGSNKIKKISFRIQGIDNIYNIVIFNQSYLVKTLKIGDNITIIGKFDKYKNSIIGSDIRDGLIKETRVESIYQLGNNINKKHFINIVNNALNSDLEIIDYLPNDIINKYKFRNKLWCIKEIHNPSSSINYKRALQRLKYEELYNYFIRLKNIRSNNSTAKYIKRVIEEEKITNFINSLSFKLTTDQLKTINEIKEDMVSDKQMNRLVQGDVGSGKTIVAMIASYINYLSGYQTAMMVPTEILANQHYSNALDLFKDTNIKVGLLTSNVKNKNKLYQAIEDGKYDLVIGTQSLIQDKVIFKNLGLIICDEQHRFGVNQRRLLINKGDYPDILSMSATPIPRTYALTIYGDMDISSIKTKPSGRLDVITYYKKESEIIDVLKLMSEELKNNHQIYVIAPSIDGDAEELDNVKVLAEKMSKAFGRKYNIGTIHGQLDAKQKNKIMTNFEQKKIDILISTTVIEVGVNVPNSSVIVIFNANNYGLSTLHQLRGRVGRSNIQSYCLLISKNECNRLRFLENCSDGFMISEYDFKNRGEGDLFGIRQSGEAKFKLASVVNDFELLKRVKEDVDNS